MDCLDCALADTPAAAVAVCVDCGSGVCLPHAHVSDRYLVVTMVMGRRVAIEPAARSVRCDTCHAAYLAWCQATPGGARLHTRS